MVEIVKLFGWLSVVISIILFAVSVILFPLFATLFPVAVSALLGGALLVVFARIVELLEALNLKLEPVHTIASSLESKYQPEHTVEQQTAVSHPADILQKPPPGAQMKEYRGRRVAILPDGTVVAETIVGPKKFQSFEAFRDFLGD